MMTEKYVYKELEKTEKMIKEKELKKKKEEEKRDCRACRK